MIDIGDRRLEQLAFDKCYSIDLTFDYLGAQHASLLQRFYSYVMPRIMNGIQSLAINLHHIFSIKMFVDNNYNGTLPNLTHLKIMLGAKQSQTGISLTIGKLLSDGFS